VRCDQLERAIGFEEELRLGWATSAVAHGVDFGVYWSE